MITLFPSSVALTAALKPAPPPPRITTSAVYSFDSGASFSTGVCKLLGSPPACVTASFTADKMAFDDTVAPAIVSTLSV